MVFEDFVFVQQQTVAEANSKESHFKLNDVAFRPAPPIGGLLFVFNMKKLLFLKLVRTCIHVCCKMTRDEVKI